MMQKIAVIIATVPALALRQASVQRSFEKVVLLETSSEDSANVNMGDQDGDGDLDLVLAKGRHTPLLDRVLLNHGRGGFGTRTGGVLTDRTLSEVLGGLLEMFAE